MQGGVGPSFASDNHSGAHPAVLEAMVRANAGYAPAYGADAWTEKARALFKIHFGAEASVFPVFNGTGANVVALSVAVKRFEAVICAEKAHIDADEGGAPERLGGMKLLTVGPSADGNPKLTVEKIRAKLSRRGDVHAVQPRVVSITQSTELGTVYSLEELRALGDFTRAEGLVFHMDGARIANAAAHLGCSLHACTTDVGVDLLSFGGTKNGLVAGEAVVDLRGKFTQDLAFVQKQSMQLASKMRFFSAQLVALLEGDLWRTSAMHANAMATLLSSQVLDLPGLSVPLPVEANGVFARIPSAWVEPLQALFPFYVWDEEVVMSDLNFSSGSGKTSVPTVRVRWMTSFQTTERNVLDFVAAIRSLA